MNSFPIMPSHGHVSASQYCQGVRNGGSAFVVVALPMALIAAHERQAHANHYQSLQRLAERGGLSASEAVAVLEDRPWRSMAEADAHRRLFDLVLTFWATKKAEPPEASQGQESSSEAGD